MPKFFIGVLKFVEFATLSNDAVLFGAFFKITPCISPKASGVDVREPNVTNRVVITTSLGNVIL